MEKIVLQKLIALAGVCSRHAAEKLIASGLVLVNGKRAKLGDRANQDDRVLVNKKLLTFNKQKIYIKLHKPVDFVCTTRSFPGEKNVLNLIKTKEQLSIVGRLDKESEGLVLLTNDGDLAYKLTHPKFGVDKVYVVTLGHDLAETREDIKKRAKQIIEQFRHGIDIGLGDGLVKANRVKYLRGRTFEIILDEGKKRQIRRMFRKLNCHVAHLTRVRIGRVTISGLRKGGWKYLSKEEINKLKNL